MMSILHTRIVYSFILTLLVVYSASNLALASNQDYEMALDSYQRGKIDTAYIHLKNVVQQENVSLPSKILMGKVLLAKGFYTDAVNEFEEALDLDADPNLIVEPLAKALLLSKQYQSVLNIESNSRLTKATRMELALLRAAAYSSENQNDTAISIYEGLLQQHPTLTRAMNALAALYLERGLIEKSESLIDTSLSIMEYDSRGWQLKGRLEESKGNLELAKNAYDQALQINPYDPIAKRALTSVLIKQGLYEEALESIAQIVVESPDDPYALMIQSRLLAQQQQFEFADKVTKELSERLKQVAENNAATNPSLSLVSGITAFLSGEYESARKHLIAYNTEEKNNVKAAALLANTYIALNEERNALGVLENLENKTTDHLPIALLLCQLYLQSNKTFKAISLLETLEKKYPSNNKITLMSAKVLVSRGKQLEAIERVEEYLKQHDDAELELFRGLLVTQLGDFEKAISIAKDLLKAEPENPDYKNFNASILIKQRNFSQANILLEGILKEYPQHFAANFNKATLLANQRKFDDAKMILSQLAERRDNYLPLKLTTAKISANTGDYDNAINQLQEIVVLWPENTEAQELLVDVYTKSQESLKAIETLKHLLDLNSMEPKYIEKKAEIYLSMDEYELAKSEMNLLKTLWSDDAYFLNKLGKLFIKANALSDAEAAFQKAVLLDSTIIEYRINLARVFLQTSQLNKAKSLIDQLSKRKNNPNILVLQGDLQKSAGDPWGSHTHYFMAYQIDNNFDLALIRLYQLSQQGIGKETFSQSASNALLNNPNNHFQRRLLADHYMLHQLSEDAIYEYNKLIRVEGLPNKDEVFNNLATLFLDQDLVKAEEYINKSLELKSDSWAALDTKGWILAKKGEYQDALVMLRQAFSRKSDSPVIRYHLAYVLVQLNRVDEARRELELALASNQSFSERDEAEALMQRI